MAKHCSEGFSVCFPCNQAGHLKAGCPQLTQGSTQAPTPATLRITDGRLGKAEASRAHGRAFQLTVEQVRASPDVVAGMYLLFNFYLNYLCLCFVSC